MITKENFKDLLILLDFKENPAQIFTKTLANNTVLKVDFKAQKLIYPANTSTDLNAPNGIIIHDDTTSNFSHPENFVVFECVHRLLQKGYKKEHIELEPRWNLGREAKGGKADILVRDNEQKPYLIIECKTTDSKNSEFVKEWRRMQTDGGQLFSYFWQEKSVKFLCLYTRDLTKPNSPQNQNAQEFSLDYQNFIIATQDNKSYLQDLSTQYKTIITGYAHATSSAEAFEVWREVYKLEYAEIGIFERNINAYEAGQNALCFADLQELSSYNDEGKTYEDGKYHEFAKILRKYNISGKENAFDKLVNLFLCKIYDENHNKEILNFCYRGNASDSIEAMQDRLMLLYKEAMKEFLGEEITYISDEQINEQFSDFKRQKIKAKHLKEQMQDFIRQLKFYSHSDFSFLEVHNKELFLQNGEVLKAVVKLFEKLKLTQNKTNQLLGNLFELFLQKGMKQDEGQFFTPMPICEFIIHSLPLETMLEKGTPKVIDYACGAGHFLNTYANILTQILPNDEQKQERLDELFSHIYGIEKEYRLSKVAKVAAAMFSQEKINITYADALDFAKFSHKDFDLLISNPPYSVKGFAQTLNKSAYAKFELKDKVSDLDSFNAIECFFIERANSLLTSKAKLAIILPSSILNKGGIYESTREIILRNFDIIAIVELGSATFGATGTNTIILFANKRETYASSQDSQSYLNLKDNIEESLSFDNVYLNAFLREYCEFMGYNQADFNEFLNGKINEILAKTSAFNEYEKAFLASSEYANLLKSKAYKDAQNQAGKESLKQASFLKFALEIEKDKLLYFALNHKTEVLIIKSPSDLKEQKKFLGYEWSNRKGDEGLKELHNPYQSQLFDRENPRNETKINVLIKNAFLQNTNQIPQELEKHALKARLVDMLDFSRAEFNKAITLNLSKGAKSANPFENSKFELVKLGEAINENPKSNIQVNQAKENTSGQFPFYTSGLNIYRFDTALISGKNIFLSTGGNALVQFFDGQCAYSTDTYAIKSIDEKEILTQFIYLILQSLTPLINEFYFKGMGLKHLQKKELKNIQIPKPPLEIQKQIVSECEMVEKQNSALNKAKQCLKELIKAILAQTGISEDETQEPTSLLNTLLEFQKTFKALSLNFKFDLNALQKDLNALPHPPQQGWERAKLGDKEYFTLNPNKKEIANLSDDTLVSFVEMASVSDEGYIQNRVDRSLKEVKKGYTYFAQNDILIAKITPCMENGKCAIATNLTNGIGFGSTEFHIFRAKKGVKQEILFLYLNDKNIRREAARNMTGASGHRRVPIEFYENLKIPLPPLKEQEKISSCIEKLETQISHLNSMLLNLETQKTNIIKGYLF